MIAIACFSLAACATANIGADDRKPLAVANHGLPDSGDRSGETAQLAMTKDVWRRENALTVDTDEGIQYRFIDAGTCEGFYTCRRWVFRGPVQIRHRSPVAGEKELTTDFWLIEFDQGEGGYYLAIEKQSGMSVTLDTQPAISDDKHMWATGDCNEESESVLTVYQADEFGRVVRVAVAAADIPCCEIIGWDGGALEVRLCEVEPGKNFSDRLVRQTDGTWRGQRVRLEKPKLPGPTR